METPSITLHYFDLAGKGEMIRLALDYYNIPFTDNRLNWNGDDYKKLKPTLRYGQLPALEFNGKMMYQSIPILKFIG